MAVAMLPGVRALEETLAVIPVAHTLKQNLSVDLDVSQHDYPSRWGCRWSVSAVMGDNFEVRLEVGCTDSPLLPMDFWWDLTWETDIAATESATYNGDDTKSLQNAMRQFTSGQLPGHGRTPQVQVA